MSNRSHDAELEKRLDRIAHQVYRAIEQKKSFDCRRVIDQYPEFRAELESFFQDLGLFQEGRYSADTLDATTMQSTPTLELGEQLGRYRIVRMLGRGGFGQVYLAHDDRLHRQVAIKVPTPERFRKPEDAERYLVEAQLVASLDHPNIVPVYDTGQTQSGMIYVVSRFIEGCTLADKIKAGRVRFPESAELIATVAMALNHAHARRLIHRDIKPSNILLEQSTGTSYLADFGLAIREEDYLGDVIAAGTPAYMSPEQARGEGHRLDTRSDIFSLGIVLYELLTGQRPFQGKTIDELLRQTIWADPIAPKQVDASIPDQLERICLKSLSKRASQRYATAAEMAEDLRCWRVSPPPLPLDKRFLPKGLRSFDAEDAGVFVDLLPGPRGRSGLPESVLFWKTRVEQKDSERTFSVGLLYGPSGCGKTSLVKAGLLPHLSNRIKVIYIEAASDDTEARILYALQKQIPKLPRDLGLADACAALRRLGDCKVLIVIDQFEQWLNSHQVDPPSELAAALRQCDGSSLQAILMVRDDFGMAATRFMDCLDIPLSQGRNFATVDLFDPDHAYKVLVKYGQAFGKLPQEAPDHSRQAKAFLDSAIDGLSQDGKIVPVRLALFAEMVKGRTWTIATLRALGGMQGIGVNFLDSTFCSPFTNPKYRVYERAVRSVLRALLPSSHANIKGHMRSVDDLMQSCDGEVNAEEFDELIQILDGDLRLITPAEQVQSVSENTQPCYQLTHDFLVPSLREWLTRKQQETRRGRTQLCLAERSDAWSTNRENRYLPSLAEWIQIIVLTKKRTWTPPQRSMMKRASRLIAGRAAILLTVVAVLWIGGYRVRAGVLSWVQRQILQTERDQIAVGLVNSLARARLQEVPEVILEMSPYRESVVAILKTELNNYKTDSAERLNISLALLPSDPQQYDFLKQRLLRCNANELDTITSLLSNRQDRLVADLWGVLGKHHSVSDREFLNAAGALAKYAPNNEEWWETAPLLVERLIETNPLDHAVWLETFRPINNYLVPSMSQVFHHQRHSRPANEIYFAANYLKDYADSDLEILSELLLDATPSQFNTWFDSLETHGDLAVGRMKQELDRSVDPSMDHDELNRSARRKAQASIALLRMGFPRPTLDRLMADVESPDLTTQFIHRCRASGVSARELLRSLDRATELRESTGGGLRSKWNRVIYALILAFGEFSLEDLSPQDSADITSRLKSWYAEDPSSAVHGACGWLLRQWGYEESVSQVDHSLVEFDTSLERDWFVIKVTPEAAVVPTPFPLGGLMGNASETLKPIYFTMIVFSPGESANRLPNDESGREGSEETDGNHIIQPFAVSDCEVTWRQFYGFDLGEHQELIESKFELEIEEDQPAVGIDWNEAVEYCDWLSSEPESGFRLLSGEEWEYACRCGTRSPYSFGNDASMLDRYAYFRGEGLRPASARRLRPNSRGLFDMHGNVWEWCSNSGSIADFRDKKVGQEAVNYPRVNFSNSDELSRVRGGGAYDSAENCRSPVYMTRNVSTESSVVGFRIGMSLESYLANPE